MGTKRLISALMAAALLAETGLMAGATAWQGDGVRSLRLLEPQDSLFAAVSDEDDADDSSSRRRKPSSEEADDSSSRRKPSSDEGADDEGGSVRERRSEMSEDGDEDRSSRRGRRERRSRRRATGAKRHKVLPGLVIPGAVLMGLGVFLIYDGFRHNPQPSGSSTLSYSYSYSGSYANLYSSGYYKNTGKGGVYPKFRFQPQTSGYTNIGSGYSYSPYTSVAEGSENYWYYYYYNYFTGGSVPARMSLSTSAESDGSYAMNNWIEGTVGIVGFAVGTALLIAGLTHTERVMDDAGVQFKLQRTSNNELALMASKTF